MTNTDRMVVWLREAMDAAEQIAHAACWDVQSEVWTARPPQASYERYTVVDYLGDGVVAVTPENADDDGVGQHIALHDPGAVLRQIGRHRKLLDLHTTPHTVVELVVEPVGELFCGECSGPCTHRGEAECALCGQDGCDTARLLAEGYGWTEETV